MNKMDVMVTSFIIHEVMKANLKRCLEPEKKKIACLQRSMGRYLH